MITGKLNRRPTFYNTVYVQDFAGGPSDDRTDEWQAWCNIENRTGNTYAAQATELTRYDYKVTVRFDSRFTSQTWMVYEGQVCRMESMSVETEGYKNYLICRYSKIETSDAYIVTETWDPIVTELDVNLITE